MDKLSQILEHSLYIYIFYKFYTFLQCILIMSINHYVLPTLSSAPTPSLIKNFVINSLKSYCIIHM